MQSKVYPVAELIRFDNLIKDYLDESQKLHQFITFFPSLEGLVEAARKRTFLEENRKVLVDVIHSQYASLQTHENVTAAIQLLSHEHTLTVTTGHQLCLFTGPLYFIYKIISTIKLSQELNQKMADKKRRAELESKPLSKVM